MTHPATSPLPQTSFLRLLESEAPTLSGNSAIRYAVFADLDRSQIFLTITTNRGGGNWNREVVSLTNIETALAEVPAGEPFGSKVLRLAFVGRSNNNAPFMAAALVHAGLMAPAKDMKHKLVRAGDWTTWANTMLARDGEPIHFPPTAPAEGQSAPPTLSVASDSGKPAKKGKRTSSAPAPTPDPDGEAEHADHP